MGSEWERRERAKLQAAVVAHERSLSDQEAVLVKLRAENARLREALARWKGKVPPMPKSKCKECDGRGCIQVAYCGGTTSVPCEACKPPEQPPEVPFAPLTEYERACEDALRPEVPVSVIPDGTMTKAERMAERERLSPTPRLPEDEVQAPVEVCPHKTLTNDAVGMGGVWRCDDCGAVASFRSRP